GRVCVGLGANTGLVDAHLIGQLALHPAGGTGAQQGGARQIFLGGALGLVVLLGEMRHGLVQLGLLVFVVEIVTEIVVAKHGVDHTLALVEPGLALVLLVLGLLGLLHLELDHLII